VNRLAKVARAPNFEASEDKIRVKKKPSFFRSVSTKITQFPINFVPNSMTLIEMFLDLR